MDELTKKTIEILLNAKPYQGSPSSMGKALKLHRQHAQLSLEDVALCCGMAIGDLIELENGKYTPSQDCLEEMCKLYQINTKKVNRAFGYI